MSTSGTPDTPIQPANIDADRHLWDGFGHRETEISAGWIVRFCQQRGRGWAPLSLSELQAYYSARRGRDERFLFNRLVPRYVTVEGDVVTLTTSFVARCYQASLATR